MKNGAACFCVSDTKMDGIFVCMDMGKGRITFYNKNTIHARRKGKCYEK